MNRTRMITAAFLLTALAAAGCTPQLAPRQEARLSPAAVAARASASCGPHHRHCPRPSPTPTSPGPTPTTPSPSPTPTSPGPTPTTTTPSPGPTPTSPGPTTPSPSPTPTGTWACTVTGANTSCPAGGDYHAYPGIVASNGYNTYVASNCWADPSCQQTLRANSAGNWQVTATEPAGNGSVMTGPELQQQANNWCTSLNEWDSQAANGCSPEGDTPLSALKSLTSTFAETMPHNSQTIAEYAYDIWTNYPNDIMVWTDTVNRCNPGAFGGTTLGTGVTIGGHVYDVYRYGGAGAEIIFVEEGAGGAGTCAQDPSGTVDILSVLNWVNSRVSAVTSLRLLDLTFEICSTGGSPETFSLTAATLAGGA